MKRQAKEKPFCESAQRWVVERLKDRAAFAPMTGQDSRAFTAFVHLVELYSVSDSTGRRSAIEAMTHTLRAMQASTRHLAKAAIPHVLDWADEDRIWQQITAVAARTTAEARP
jgi:hypothetical protein